MDGIRFSSGPNGSTAASPEFMSRAEMAALQDERFSAAWSYVAATPFYKRKLQQAGLQSRDVKSLQDLTKIPFTYKDEIRSTSVFDRTPLSPEQVYAIYSSNGTSGERTLYAWNIEDTEIQTEVARRILRSVGVTSADLGLVVAPLSLPVMGHCMLRQYAAIGAGFIPIGQATPDDIIKCITTLPVTAIATLPIVASRLAEYMQFVVHRVMDADVHVRQLHLGGDFFSSALRQRLEKAWHASCYDFYGMSEIFGPVCGECPQQEGMHFAADFVFTEVLDPQTGEPVEEGERGVAVYTTLWKKGFPLLRYWTDDYVTWSWQPCRCGRTAPRVRFWGRTVDFADLPRGRLFAKDVEERLLQFQVTSEFLCERSDSSDPPQVKVHVEPFGDDPLCASELVDAMEELFDIAVEIQVHEPGSLPRSESKPKRLVGFDEERPDE